jgi:hypothetical protein
MRNNLKIFLYGAMLVVTVASGVGYAFASEISGSLSSTPQTYSGQGNISGNVGSPSSQSSGEWWFIQWWRRWRWNGYAE